MRRKIRKIRDVGITLIELLVYSGLVVLLFGMVGAFFDYASRNAQITRASIEVEQAGQVLGYRVSRELMETSASTLEFYPSSSHQNAPVGVVFLSARDANGRFVYDPDSGLPMWQRYVGYYLDADPQAPEDERVTALYRAELVPAGLPTVEGVAGSALGATSATLRADGVNRRVVAHGIRAPSGDDRGGFDAYSMADGDKTYEQSAGPVYVDMELVNYSARVSQHVAGLDNGNSITSGLRVTPRN